MRKNVWICDGCNYEEKTEKDSMPLNWEKREGAFSPWGKSVETNTFDLCRLCVAKWEDNNPRKWPRAVASAAAAPMKRDRSKDEDALQALPTTSL